MSKFSNGKFRVSVCSNIYYGQISGGYTSIKILECTFLTIRLQSR